MKMDKQKSNLLIRSNVYPMPETMAKDIKILEIIKTIGGYEDYFNFMSQITGLKLYEKLPVKIQNEISENKKDLFDFCSKHKDKAMTYGPVKKGKEIIHTCRCNLKNTCESKKILRKN
jgi:hypothetical protein